MREMGDGSITEWEIPANWVLGFLAASVETRHRLIDVALEP